MFNVGGGELLVIMLLALIVLGPQRLPEAARTVGRVMGDLRRLSSGFQQELRDALDDTGAGAPATRSESVPLAASVADADKGREGEPASTVPTDESTVAPAVAAALDEIVTPLDPPPAVPGDAAGDAGDIGDERAAS